MRLLLVVVLASALAGGAGAVAPPKPSVFVSPTGSDASCARGSTRPCQSFNRAFQLARGGDVVELAGGVYPGQTIEQHSPPLAVAVTLRAAAGAKVLLADDIDIKASRFHLVGVSSAGLSSSGPANRRHEAMHSLDVCDDSSDCPRELTDVLVQGFVGKAAFIRSSGVTIKGGDFGAFDACRPGNPEDGFRLWGGGGAPQPSNDVVDGVTIHDVDSGQGYTCQGTPNAGIHVDCMQTTGGVHIVIRNSTFFNCPTSDIQAEPFAGAAMRDWLVQNNFFGPTACCNSVVLGQPDSGDCSTFVFRYNVAEKLVNSSDCGGPGGGNDALNLNEYGNVYVTSQTGCGDNTTLTFDVFVRGSRAGTCNGQGANASNRRCNPSFAGGPQADFPLAGPPNYHLLPTDRCARGAGDPARFPRTDRDGNRRPAGLPDAGADEIP